MEQTKKQLLYNYQNQHLSHAYLFVGNNTLELSFWLAALLRQKGNLHQLAEEMDYIRAQYAIDVILLDGSQETIKKEAVLTMLTQFMKSAKEQSALKIAIINQLENSTPQALNTLLKSIEEPNSKDMYFLFNTNDISKILPTISSRCIIYYVNNELSPEVQNYLKECSLDRILVEYIRQINPTLKQLKAVLADEKLKLALKVQQEMVKLLQNQSYEAVALWSIALENDKEALNYFIDLMIIYFRLQLITQTQNLLWFGQLLYIFIKLKNYTNRSISNSQIMDSANAKILEVLTNVPK